MTHPVGSSKVLSTMRSPKVGLMMNTKAQIHTMMDDKSNNVNYTKRYDATNDIKYKMSSCKNLGGLVEWHSGGLLVECESGLLLIRLTKCKHTRPLGLRSKLKWLLRLILLTKSEC